MKKKSLLILFSFITVFAVAQVKPGTYRFDKDQNEADVTIMDNQLHFKSFYHDMILVKNGEGYINPEYRYTITSSQGEGIVFSNETNTFAESLSLYAPEEAITLPEGIIEFIWNEKKYYATATNLDGKIIGEYLYEGGEPKASLQDGGSGFFQRHMVSPSPFSWWGIETNYKGEIQKINYGEDYKVILVVLYGEGGSKYDTPGTYDRMELMVLSSMQKTALMGERILQW